MDDRAEPGLTNLSAERTPVTFDYNLPKKKSKKGVVFLILGVIVLTVAGILVFKGKIVKNAALSAVQSSTPVPTAIPTPAPVPAPVLVRSEWSFEVLNGSGKSGFAKSISGSLKELDYQVVKIGNADKSSAKTQILVKKELLEKTDLIIADLKDIIKIATISGELEDSTASARIIIGKDSI